jgi:hypothetical protein
MKSKLPKIGEEIESLRLALALTGVCVNSQTACLINEVFKSVQEKGGKFNVEDACRIEYDVRQKYNRIGITAIPNEDKVNK